MKIVDEYKADVDDDEIFTDADSVELEKLKTKMANNTASTIELCRVVMLQVKKSKKRGYM